MARRRSRSPNLFLAIPLFLVLLVAVAGLAVFIFVDPNSFKPRIIQAVRASTGRDLALKGPITLALSLQPTLRATDVSFSNPPGFSRPQMATLQQAEVQLALWPLLSGKVQIIRLVLTDPDVSLETNAAGQSNWKMSPAVPSAPAASPGVPSAPSAPSAAPSPPAFDVAAVQIDGGKLAWINAATAQTQIVDIQNLIAKTATPGGPISASANFAVADHKIALTAETGPLAQLLGAPAGATGWPLQLVARVEGARLAASGTIQQPLDGRGYQLTLDASVPDLASAGKVLGRTLPDLRDVSAAAKLSDVSGLPVPASIVVHAGASDLGDIAPGLTLDHLDLTAPALDQPMHADIVGMFAGQKLRLVADVGAIASLMPSAAATPPGPFPVALDIEAAGATLTAKGGVANPLALTGLDLAISARVPDLAALSPLVQQPLPALQAISFDGHVADGEGGIAKTIVLRGLSLSSPDGDVAGDVTVTLKPRLDAVGTLAGKRLDLDALQAAYAKAPSFVAPPFVPPGKPAPPPAPRPPAGPKRLFSDQPFDLSVISGQDADLRLSMGEIRSGGISYRDLSDHVVLDHGKLTVDPFAATLPGGKLDLRLLLDTAVTPAKMTLALSAPGLALKPLLTALHEPDDVTGTVELMADVMAEGNSAHQLASSLSGKLGIVMPDGELDNVLLGNTVGTLLRATSLPAELFGGNGGGRTRIKCAAIRIDAIKGQASLNAFVLDTARALVQGNGAINLDAETLGLRIRPMLRTGGPGIVIPVQVTGRIESPNAKVDSGGALQGTATGIAGGLLGGLAGLARNPAATLTNALVGERGGDACGPAIAAARGARPVLKP
jgi:AsmA protein